MITIFKEDSVKLFLELNSYAQPRLKLPVHLPVWLITGAHWRVDYLVFVTADLILNISDGHDVVVSGGCLPRRLHALMIPIRANDQLPRMTKQAVCDLTLVAFAK